MLVTCHAEAVVDGEDVDAYASGVRGLLRSLALEESGQGLKFYLIDVDDLDSDWLNLLKVSEWDECALRQGRVYERVLHRSELVDSSDTRFLNKAGYVLITGGLGSLGLLVAGHLITEGVLHLCLVGRRAPSQEAEERIAAFRAQGVEVLVRSLDVTDEAAVAQLVSELHQSEVSLTGVIHAAGALHDGLLANLDWSTFSEVLPAKISGALALHRATESLNLSYFITFSSIASSMGSPGQTNYALANAFLDGLMHHRRHLGLVGHSINWGAWQDEGMAARSDEAMRRRREQGGMKGLSTQEALSALSKIMHGNRVQVTVAKIDWEQVAHQPEFHRLSSIKGLLPARDTTVHYPRFLLLQGQKSAQRRDAVIKIVREQCAAVLGTKKELIPVDVGFFTLGMDSLMAVDLRNRLQQEIGELVQLPASFVLDYPTLNDLIDYFDTLLSHQQKNTEIITLGNYQLEPIAVIGMAGVFPGGCTNPEDLWQLLMENRSGIVDYPRKSLGCNRLLRCGQRKSRQDVRAKGWFY